MAFAEIIIRKNRKIQKQKETERTRQNYNIENMEKTNKQANKQTKQKTRKRILGRLVSL